VLIYVELRKLVY